MAFLELEHIQSRALDGKNDAEHITVSYEPAPGRVDADVAAIDELGYEATVQPKGARATP